MSREDRDNLTIPEVHFLLPSLQQDLTHPPTDSAVASRQQMYYMQLSIMYSEEMLQLRLQLKQVDSKIRYYKNLAFRNSEIISKSEVPKNFKGINGSKSNTIQTNKSTAIDLG